MNVYRTVVASAALCRMVPARVRHRSGRHDRSVPPLRRALSPPGSGARGCPAIRASFHPGRPWSGPHRRRRPCPLDVTLKPRDPAALAAEAQAGVRSEVSGVPPLPDAGSSSRGSSDRRRPRSRRSPPALRQEGLTVGTPSATGLSLPVSGTVAQVQSAFSTPISKYRLPSGKTGYDNASAPEVPRRWPRRSRGSSGSTHSARRSRRRACRRRARAVPHAASDLAAPALGPGAAHADGHWTSAPPASTTSRRPHRRARCRRAGAGVLVRPAVLVERLRGRHARSRSSRCPGRATASSDITTLRRLLRDHARQRADQRR